MNFWDYFILAAVGLLLLSALLQMRNKKKTGCPGCCSGCAGCSSSDQKRPGNPCRNDKRNHDSDWRPL